MSARGFPVLPIAVAGVVVAAGALRRRVKLAPVRAPFRARDLVLRGEAFAPPRVARKIDGFPTTLLTETLLGIPTAAHILGGCCMGAHHHRARRTSHEQDRGERHRSVRRARVVC